MDIVLFSEKDFKANLNIISESLNKMCSKLNFQVGKSPLLLKSKIIKHPEEYIRLSKGILNETKNSFKSFLFTDRQYNNNYFFQTFENKAIISFSGWEYLTNLSRNNGVVYFIADLLALALDNSFRHDKTTGCIYDFGWNKTEIDLEMRNAFICSSCLARITSKKFSTEQSDIFIDLREILDVLGKTSKWNQDIVQYWKNSDAPKSPSKKLKLLPMSDIHDVFIAHNSIDKPIVKIISNKLREKGIRPWLDNEQIPPGRCFQDILQEAITKISSVAIIIGENGVGNWQKVELRSFISQCVDKGMPIIPVLLPVVKKIPSQFVFLNEFQWVKYKKDIHEEEALDNLIWGITGKHPKREDIIV